MPRGDRSFPFALSAHAAKVIEERSIPLSWIKRALTQPERMEPDSDDPQVQHALARIPEHENRVLRVVYNNHVEPWRIVPVYFDRAMKGRL